LKIQKEEKRPLKSRGGETLGKEGGCFFFRERGEKMSLGEDDGWRGYSFDIRQNERGFSALGILHPPTKTKKIGFF